MVEPSASSSAPAVTFPSRGASSNVQPLSRAAQRPCARPGCPTPARATLRFAYATAQAVLERLADVADPQAYDLCVAHAGRTQPPRGWTLVDERPLEDRAEPERPTADRDLGGEATVAVLAAALRAVPDPAPVGATPVDGPAPVVDEPSPVVDDASRPDAVPPEPEPEVELPAPRPVPAAARRTARPATDW